MVRIQGLSGRFPDALRVDRIEVSDAKGPYVTISGLVLDWSPLQLVHRIAQIDQLQADQLDFSRLPESEKAKTNSAAARSTCRSRSICGTCTSPRPIIGAPVAGAAATLALDGAPISPP